MSDNILKKDFLEQNGSVMGWQEEWMVIFENILFFCRLYCCVVLCDLLRKV